MALLPLSSKRAARFGLGRCMTKIAQVTNCRGDHGHSNAIFVITLVAFGLQSGLKQCVRLRLAGAGRYR